jgi:FAD/FMN-containing dehydrogenase
MKAYTLDRVRTPSVAAAMHGMLEHFGVPTLPDEMLASIAVPTSLIWGRRDSVVPLAVGRSASERYGWPLHVIENAGNEPAIEEPAAFVEAVRLRGPVLRAGDDGWEDATEVWNAMAAKTPAIVVQPASARDVVAAIAFARGRGLPLSVKGGGHNIAGTSIAEDGLVLDMSAMSQVTVDAAAQVAHVGPGCRLRDIDAATQAHGLAVPLGFISDVGVAGLTLGGGLGYLTRRFGWTVDNLLEVEIVTAGGQIRTASRHQNADLFWAVRGAGANMGVVTRFTFRLHEVGPTVVGGLIAWPFARADEILRAYRTITVEAPRELAVWLVLLHAPPAPFVPPELHGAKLCAMAVCYTGDVAEAETALAPIRALGDPVVDLLHEQPYRQVQSYLDATEPKGMHYYWKTDFLTELGDDMLSALPELFAHCPIPDGEFGILHLAGALNERDEDDGAVGNRDARYVFGVKGMWAPGEPNEDRYRDWVRNAWTRLHPLSTGRTYINFQTADEDESRVRATYGANYARLVDVKRTYDPENVFSSNRNVRPDA